MGEVPTEELAKRLDIVAGILADDRDESLAVSVRSAAALIRAQAVEIDRATRYAEQLATSLVQKHFPDVPQWRPLSGDLYGLLTQIDNTTCGMERADQGGKEP
jgi:hypothetical protein